MVRFVVALKVIALLRVPLLLTVADKPVTVVSTVLLPEIVLPSTDLIVDVTCSLFLYAITLAVTEPAKALFAPPSNKCDSLSIITEYPIPSTPSSPLIVQENEMT